MRGYDGVTDINFDFDGQIAVKTIASLVFIFNSFQWNLLE